MNPRYRIALILPVAALLCQGCAAFRASTKEVDVEKEKHFDEGYDYSDMRRISKEVTDELLAGPFLSKFQEPPIFVIAGVENRTGSYVDTKGLTDKMRTALFQSGKGQFVNEARRDDLLKEQGYQAANVTPETMVAVGKQLGAKFMISGSLLEMSSSSEKQVRVSKQKLSYYKLTIEITDLETGLLAWTTEKEFARQASLPLIGW